MDFPVSVVGAKLKLKNYWNTETDELTLPGCANITNGCVVGANENIFAIYLPSIGELSLMSINDDGVPPEFQPARKRRRVLLGRELLQDAEDPVTDDFADALSGAYTRTVDEGVDDPPPRAPSLPQLARSMTCDDIPRRALREAVSQSSTTE